MSANGYMRFVVALSLLILNYGQTFGQSDQSDSISDLSTHKIYNDSIQSYFEQISAFNKAYDLEAGINLSRRLIRHIGQDASLPDTLMAKSYILIAGGFYRMYELDSVQYYADRSIKSLDEDIPNREKYLSRSNNLLGIVSYSRGNFEEAQEYFSKSIELELELEGKANSNIAKLYNNLALISDKLGDLTSSIGFHNKSIEIRRELHKELSQDMALSYNNIGTVYNQLGDYKAAIEFYNKSLYTYNQIGLAEHPRAIYAYANLGAVFASYGDFEKSLFYGFEYLRRSKELLSNNHPQVGDAYLSVAGDYGALGYHELELEYLEKARNVFQASVGEFHYQMAVCYQGFAWHYLSRLDFDSAIKFLNKAQLINSQVFGEESREVAGNLLSISIALREKSDYKLSELSLKEAIRIRKKNNGNAHVSLANFYNSLANTYAQNKQFELARENYTKAFKNVGYDQFSHKFDSVENLYYLNNILQSLTSYYVDKYKDSQNGIFLDSVEIVTELNSNLLEKQISLATSPKSKQLFIKEYNSLVDKFLKIRSECNFESIDLHADFDLIEKSKAYQLLNTISKSAMEYDIPNNLLTQEKANKLTIGQLEKKIYNTNRSPETASDSLLAKLDEELFLVRRDYDNLLTNLKSNYPEYYKLQFNDTYSSLSELQQNCSDGNRTYLEYFLGDDILTCYLINKDSVIVSRNIIDYPLEGWIKNLRTSLTESFIGRKEIDDQERYDWISEYSKSANDLFLKLIAPFESYVPRHSELIIIPDGVLGYIPFEALLSDKIQHDTRTRDYPYLIKDYQISYAYSATLLKEMQDKQHRKTPSKGFFGVAPLFAGEMDTTLYASRFIDYSNPRNRLSPLTGNIPEVHSLQAIVGGDILIDSAATEAAFISKASDYRVLHLSTHGKANDKAGDYSFLAFYELKDSLENEWLYNRELYNLDLNADMVVLSACETGIGELQRGEGIISLARGFSYAGAKSIITSLWTVDDQESPVLMSSFYNYLKDGKTKDAALRQAKLDYISTSSKPEPYYWAAFIPIGDMQAINFDNPTPYWRWGFIVVIALIVGLWLIKKLKKDIV